MSFRKRDLVAALHVRLRDLNLDTQEDLASWLGKKGFSVHQSTISRLLCPTGKRLSPKMKEICKYASVDWKNFMDSPDPKTCKPVLDAVAAAWDGTADHARLLARLINAASALQS